jgi:hypothetical protein
MDLKQYIVLVHGDADAAGTVEEWTLFFKRAEPAGLFRGGIISCQREVVGKSEPPASSKGVSAFLFFFSDDKAKILEVLRLHPAVLHGGTAEVCEVSRPKSSTGEFMGTAPFPMGNLARVLCPAKPEIRLNPEEMAGATLTKSGETLYVQGPADVIEHLSQALGAVGVKADPKSPYGPWSLRTAQASRLHKS